MLMAKNHFTTKNIILIVIVLAILTVAFTTFFIFILKPENVIKKTIPAIATDYYENYFYPEITKDNVNSLSNIFSKYTDTGFSPITFRQLLFYNNKYPSDTINTIVNHCDLRNSYIQIYPTPPFGKFDYHIDYHYTCQF